MTTEAAHHRLLGRRHSIATSLLHGATNSNSRHRVVLLNDQTMVDVRLASTLAHALGLVRSDTGKGRQHRCVRDHERCTGASRCPLCWQREWVTNSPDSRSTLSCSTDETRPSVLLDGRTTSARKCWDQPRVHGERLFSDSPRPESLDENAATVLTPHRLIGPLDLDHWLRLERIGCERHRTLRDDHHQIRGRPPMRLLSAQHYANEELRC